MHIVVVYFFLVICWALVIYEYIAQQVWATGYKDSFFVLVQLTADPKAYWFYFILHCLLGVSLIWWLLTNEK